MAEAARDGNYVPTLIAVSNADGTTPVRLYADPTTHRLLVNLGGAGSGTVTDVSVVSANGFAGSVANSTTTPAITLTTTITGILSGNGTAISAASTTGSGNVVLATGPTIAGATFTGVVDAGGADSFEIPNSAAPTVNADGEIAVDTTVTDFSHGLIKYYSGEELGVVAMPIAQFGTPTDGYVVTYNGTADEFQLAATATTVPTTITVADEATDTSCFLGFFTAASGDLGPKTNVNMTFNSNTGVVTFASAVLTTADINGGTVDGAIIGGSSAAAITGTTITANTGFMPDADDGAYLGQSGTGFADLFLASGGVINWNAGNATLTHSASLLTSNVAFTVGTSNAITCGTIELGAASDTTLARSAAGQVTIEGVQIDTASNTLTLTNKTISHTVEPATDDTFTGEQITGFNATATIAQWEAVYLSTTGWALTDADAAATAGGVFVGLAAAAGTNTNPLTVVTRGVIRNDGWTWATVGAPLYLSTTAGALTETAPSGTDDVIRVMGYVMSDDCIYLNPSNDWITHT